MADNAKVCGNFDFGLNILGNSLFFLRLELKQLLVYVQVLWVLFPISIPLLLLLRSLSGLYKSLLNRGVDGEESYECQLDLLSWCPYTCGNGLFNRTPFPPRNFGSYNSPFLLFLDDDNNFPDDTLILCAHNLYCSIFLKTGCLHG